MQTKLRCVTVHEKGIETFLAVAMSRTLGKAADLLNVTQSTISYNLSELESEMGMILVERQKGMKSVHLTPDGESFLPLALKWQDVSREISDAKNPGSACTLSVGGSDYVNCRLMTGVYRDLMSHNPPVSLKVTSDSSDRMYQYVESMELDTAIVLHEEKNRYVQTERFFSEPMTVARIPSDRENPSEYVSSDLLQPELECYIEWSAAYRLWHDHFLSPSDSSALRLDSVTLAASMMSEEGQWCVIPISAKCLFEREGRGAIFQNMAQPAPNLVYYKLTHITPKVSSVLGLAIFGDISSKRGFN